MRTPKTTRAKTSAPAISRNRSSRPTPLAHMPLRIPQIDHLHRIDNRGFGYWFEGDHDFVLGCWLNVAEGPRDRLQSAAGLGKYVEIRKNERAIHIHVEEA